MLPRVFKPVVKTPLIRIGAPGDGGYVIPQKALGITEILYGFGVSNNWEFERAFHELTQTKVICCDHSMTSRFWRQLFKHDLLEWCRLRNRRTKMLGRRVGCMYADYRKFFDGHKAEHRKVMIALQSHDPTRSTAPCAICDDRSERADE